MFLRFLGWLLSLLSGQNLGRVLDVVSKSVDRENEQRLAELRALTSEDTNLARFNEAKLQHRVFWGLILLFTVPLGIWWAAVIADSIFFFPFDIADLPTPEMRAWAGDMIRWLFYVGSVTAALKVVTK
jgi:hypothetical protein